MYTMIAPISGNVYTTKAGRSYRPTNLAFIQNVDVNDIVDLAAAGCSFINDASSQGRDNLVATTDPGVSNDNTQDYAPGSTWVNSTDGRVWFCQSAATGAAAWALANVPGVGVDPASTLTQFGGAAYQAANGAFTEEGNLYRGQSVAGVGNAADTTDDVLFGIALPANVFNAPGRGLNLTAFGQTAATTNNKRVKLWFNATFSGGTLTAGVQVGGTVTAGTVVADTGNWVNATTPNSNVGWNLFSIIYKVGAAGANTQTAQGQAILGATHGGVGAVSSPTATESGVINVAVTGSSYTTGAASDVLCNSFAVNAMN
jgi:hypothetical protein